MSPIQIKEATVNLRGTRIAFRGNPFNVWVSIPGSISHTKKLTTRIWTIIFPAMYDPHEIVDILKRLPILDSKVVIDLDKEFPIKLTRPFLKKQDIYKDRQRLPLKLLGKGLKYSVEIPLVTKG